MLLATRGKRVDLVFVIDTTGSMSDKIKGLLQTTSKFLDRFARLQMDARIAIVAFGDLTVRTDKIVATGFTSNLQTTKNSCKRFRALAAAGTAASLRWKRCKRRWTCRSATILSKCCC